MFIIWWSLAWDTLDAVRIATLGTWSLHDSELVLGAGDFGWLVVTWALLFFEEALEVLSNTSEHTAASLEGGFKSVA